jgi:hypothetical protein
MDQVVVSVLQSEPSKLGLVVEWIEKRLADPEFSIQAKDSLSEWLEIIRVRGVSGVIEVLGDLSEKATRLRQSSPFGVLMPEEERLRILRRYEALRPRTHPAGI